MDPISGLFTLLILIAFAYGMYLAYQKFVVEGGLFETPAPPPVESTQVVQSAPASEVPGVNSAKGRPNSSAVHTGKQIYYYGNSEKLLGDGRAKTASVCYEVSKQRGINNWGWDRKNKSCFAYVDSNVMTAMSDKTKVEGTSQYVVGCSEPGVTPLQGCMDLTGGDRVRGLPGSTHSVIDNGPVSFDQCRKIALDKGYDTFLYTPNRYAGVHVARCFSKDSEEVRGYTGDVTDMNHMVACTDPSKKVANACE